MIKVSQPPYWNSSSDFNSDGHRHVILYRCAKCYQNHCHVEF